MNVSAIVHSLWTCVGLCSQNDYCFSLPRSHCVPPSLLSRSVQFAGSALLIAVTRGHVRLKLHFAALAGGALGFISSCLRFPGVSSLSSSLFLFLPVFSEVLRSPLCDDSLMNFSLCYLHITPLFTSLMLFLSLACLIVCF